MHLHHERVIMLFDKLFEVRVGGSLTPVEAKGLQGEFRVVRHLNHECVAERFEVWDIPGSARHQAVLR